MTTIFQALASVTTPALRTTATATLAVGALAAASLPAHAVTLVGLNSQAQLAMIDTGNVSAATNLAITGLDAGDRLVGIDTRPSDGMVYGVSLSNRIYTVNTSTGAASFVAALDMPVVQANLAYGIDFNPSADFAGGSSLRLVSNAGSNFAINAGTGVVGNAASNIGTGYTAVAYSNSVTMPTMAPPSTQLYYISSATDMLYMAPNGFNSPTIDTIGALGVDVLNANGFELLPDNTAFAALNVDGGTSLATGIYGIDLGTGQATLLGTYNGTLSGLSSVSAVPEPQTVALMLAGLAGVGFIARRRRASAFATAD
jgi:hypothetical protein